MRAVSSPLARLTRRAAPVVTEGAASQLAPADPLAPLPRFVAAGETPDEEATRLAAEEEYRRKVAAEEAATGGVTSPPWTNPPGDTSAPHIELKADYVRLETQFGVGYVSSLSPEQAAAEAEWHRREALGFPDDPPTDALYREHYASQHPGVTVPQRPGTSAGPRSGRLDPASVTMLGLIPLGSAQTTADKAFYEPAVVVEGSLVRARDGSWHRVSWLDGRLVAAAAASPAPADGTTPAPSQTPYPTPSSTPPGGMVTQADADARVAAAEKSAKRRALAVGALGGLLLGAAAMLVAAAISKRRPAADADGQAPRKGLPKTTPARPERNEADADA